MCAAAAERQSKVSSEDTTPASGALGRAVNMRLLCLMRQGRGDWESVQDKDAGTVQYRNNATMDLFPQPPKIFDRFGHLTALRRLRTVVVVHGTPLVWEHLHPHRGDSG